jgi:hypothetical protein
MNEKNFITQTKQKKHTKRQKKLKHTHNTIKILDEIEYLNLIHN